MTKDRQAIHPHQQGFTLIEIMVTLGVLAIVATLVSPAIMQMAPNMRLRTATADLHANLMRAKSTAVKMNRNVVFSITTAVNCAPAVFDPGGNGGAYQIFVDDGGGNIALARNNIWNLVEADTDADGVLDAAEDLNGNGERDEQILTGIDDAPGSQQLDGQADALPDSVALCLPANTTVTNGFTPTGLLLNPAVVIAITLQSSQGDQYLVSVSPAGSVSTAKL